jgi:hypothetical protein
VDRCAGQCDDEVLHAVVHEPLATVYPTSTEAMAPPKEMAEPTMGTLSRLD